MITDDEAARARDTMRKAQELARITVLFHSYAAKHALEEAILAQPYGPIRNDLCDANIMLGKALLALESR